ncbi:hypothetical protein [Rubellicoccus peritrichatus]|uniref:PEP-CTERM protein-sorting domain-containing protein n=1 Tax=Rubellicoccus peritrichatus TaxID=3080537 RepID=A0AAQ3LEI5_9BACT|nr:hypothetical protein [Puniceicoccus sp. CR14]WOO42475.1 hypothetical protein RZN69_05190 [Puniceicoccus sp. CR14]
MNNDTTTIKTTTSALAGLFAATGMLDAAVVFNNTTFSFGPPGVGDNTLFWDIDGNNSSTALVSGPTQISSMVASKTSVNMVFNAVSLGFIGAQLNTAVTSRVGSIQNSTGPIAQNLGNSYQLGPSNFTNTAPYGIGYFSYCTCGPFQINTPGIIGFRFSTDGGTTFNYGYVNVIFDDTVEMDGIFRIEGWAYETDPDTPIVTPVPEPTTTAIGLGTLALGAAGLRQWRKNRRTN